MSSKQRMLDAKYDEESKQYNNVYNKCEYCYKIITDKQHVLEKGFIIFCSNKCRKMWLLDQSNEKLIQTNPERFKL